MATSQTEARIVLSAVDNTSRAFATARQGLSGLGSVILNVQGLLSGIGAFGAATFLAGVINEAREAVDGFNDLSDATGSSIENISALDSVARATGAGFDQVSSILVKFNQVLAEADPTKGAGAVLKALNLDIEQLKRLDPAEALRQTAVALSGFSDDGNKARAVQELFGKSVREAAPFLKDLAEKNKLVATTSTETAEEIDKYNKMLSQFRANSEDLSRSLATRLIPVLNRVYTDISTFSEKSALASLAGDVIRFKEELDALQARKGSPFNFAGNLDQEIAKAEKRLADAKARFKAADVGGSPSAGGGRGFVNPSLVRPSLDVPDDEKKPKAPKGPKDTPFAGLTYDEQIKQRVGRLFEDSDVVKAKEFADTLAVLDDLYFSGAIGQELYDAARKQLNGSMAAGADETSEFVQEQKRMKELLEDSPELKSQRLDLELLTRAFQAGKLSAEAYLNKVSERLNLVGQKTKEAKSFAEEFGLTFSSAMEDAIVKGGSFSDVLEGIAQDLARIVLRKSVTEPLGDALSKLDFGSLFSSFLPSAQGNVFSGAPALSAYSNTVVNRPTVFPFAKGMGLMGEAGAEAIMPLTRLANGDLGVGVKGGGGVDRITVRLVNESGTPLQATSQRQGTAEDGSRLIEVILAAAGDAVANRSGPLARGLEVGYGLK